MDERDSLFVDLRHKHFAAASLKISGLLDEFRARNAKVSGGKSGRGMGDLELRNMSKLIQSLPQYRCGAEEAGRGSMTGAHARPAAICCVCPDAAADPFHAPAVARLAGISCPSWRRTWRLPARLTPQLMPALSPIWASWSRIWCMVTLPARRSSPSSPHTRASPQQIRCPLPARRLDTCLPSACLPAYPTLPALPCFPLSTVSPVPPTAGAPADVLQCHAPGEAGPHP